MEKPKSRLLGKSLDTNKPDDLKSRLLGRSLGKSTESLGGKLEKGAVLINAGMAETDPTTAEFTITDIVEQEGRGTVYLLENKHSGGKTSKSEKILKEEMEHGKYRFKE